MSFSFLENRWEVWSFFNLNIKPYCLTNTVECNLQEVEHGKSPVITSLTPENECLKVNNSVLIKSIKHHHESVWGNLFKEHSSSLV